MHTLQGVRRCHKTLFPAPSYRATKIWLAAGAVMTSIAQCCVWVGLFHL